jgi:hypothetical protein
MAGHDISAGGHISTVHEMRVSYMEAGMHISLTEIKDDDSIQIWIVVHPGKVTLVRNALNVEVK